MQQAALALAQKFMQPDSSAPAAVLECVFATLNRGLERFELTPGIAGPIMFVGTHGTDSTDGFETRHCCLLLLIATVVFDDVIVRTVVRAVCRPPMYNSFQQCVVTCNHTSARITEDDKLSHEQAATAEDDKLPQEHTPIQLLLAAGRLICRHY
jgi:hypothetical protein